MEYNIFIRLQFPQRCAWCDRWAFETPDNQIPARPSWWRIHQGNQIMNKRSVRIYCKPCSEKAPHGVPPQTLEEFTHDWNTTQWIRLHGPPTNWDSDKRSLPKPGVLYKELTAREILILPKEAGWPCLWCNETPCVESKEYCYNCRLRATFKA